LELDGHKIHYPPILAYPDIHDEAYALVPSQVSTPVANPPEPSS